MPPAGLLHRLELVDAEDDDALRRQAAALGGAARAADTGLGPALVLPAPPEPTALSSPGFGGDFDLPGFRGVGSVGSSMLGALEGDRRAGLKGLPTHEYRRPLHETPTAGDLVNRDAPDLSRATDITEHPTREGKVYCAVVLDSFSRRVVGRSTDASQTSALVTNALSMAIGKPPARRDRHTLRSRRPVHLLGLHRTRPRVPPGPAHDV